MATQLPTRISITSYQVGFGDCFLLRFEYPTVRRHVLVDFGTKLRSKVKFKADMKGVAKKIQDDCGGKLDIVVATHRHYDHISGFERSKSKDGPGDIIKACRPNLVIQPWTEDPKLAKNATAPTAAQKHIQSLIAMNELAAAIANAPPAFAAKGAKTKGAGDGDAAAELSYLGGDNITNKDAVENLMSMAGSSPKAYRYLSLGDKLDVSTVLPGVTVHVFGPPTLAQAPNIKNYAQSSDQYWKLQAAALSPALRNVPRARTLAGGRRNVPQPARWFVRQLRQMHGDSLLEIVRTLDKVMNNTSLILVFETGSKRLLFPGDAQLENWSAALADEKIRTFLAGVDLYKVGHHGSENATPRLALWEKFAKRGPKFRTLLSTHAGEYSGVPRESLHEALVQKSELLTTEDFAPGELSRTVTIDL